MCTENKPHGAANSKTICTCVNGNIYLVFLLKDILVTTIEPICFWVLYELDTGSTCIFIFETGHYWHCLEEFFRETEDIWNQSLLLPLSFSFYVYALNVNWTCPPPSKNTVIWGLGILYTSSCFPIAVMETHFESAT